MLDKQRFEAMAEMRRSGLTDREIAEAHGGISRERVRQILADVPRNPKTPRTVKSAPVFPCSLCAKEIRGRNAGNTKIHLCADHKVMRSQLWRLIDDSYFSRHQQIMLKQSGRSAPTYDGIWKQRERRWLIVGSAMHTSLLEAYRMGLPIIDLLPPIIKTQLERDSKIVTNTEKDNHDEHSVS